MGKRKKYWGRKYILKEKIPEENEEKNQEEEQEQEKQEVLSSRKIRRKKIVYFENTSWTISDKARLLEGLKQFGFYHLDKVADFVKTKDLNEIRLYLENRRAYLLRKQKGKKDDKYNKKTIIQTWYDAASSEVPSRYKRDDSSILFAELFSNAAKYEPHLKPRTASDPDIGAIYQYFADMLNGVFSADLRPTDSTIVLSLLHTLGNIISKGNFNLEKEMYSDFKGTNGNGTLLCECDDDYNDYDLNKNDSSSAAKLKNMSNTNKQNNSKIIDDDSSSFNVDDRNVTNCDNDSNTTSIRSEADDTNKSDENSLNRFNKNVSNITNDDSDSNVVQMQIECNPENVPMFKAETNSNTDDIEDNEDSAVNYNNSQEIDSDIIKNSHFLWKQFQLSEPFNKKLAKKLKRVIQIFNPLQVPPLLLQIEHDIIRQFC